MTTVSKLNVNEIPLLIPIIVQTGVKNYGFARYCPNPGDVDAMITPKEYREFLEKMWTVYMKYKECGTRFALKDHLWKLFLYEKGLYDIFFGEEMEQYRKFNEFQKCKECELLRFCRGCPSVAKCATGDFYASDPQFWK